MADGQICGAVCSGNARVEGAFKCISGMLTGASYCISEAGVTTENVTKIVGTIKVEVTGSPTVDSLTKAIADAFGLDPQYVDVFFNAATSSGRLLLSASESAPPRFLASRFNVQYEVVVTPNMTQSTLISAAKALSESNSTVGKAFMQSMLNSGVTVLSVAPVHSPIAVQSIVVKDQSGGIIKPGQPAPGPGPKKDSDVNIGAIIGGVVGGAILLLIIAASVRYCWMQRASIPKSEA